MRSLSESGKNRNRHFEYIVLGLILAFTAVTRFLFLKSYPNGIHQDESYCAYNAYSLMMEGIDSRGYGYPVYCTAWGDGQTVLYALIGSVFFRFLGVSILTFRLPQALLSLTCVLYGWKLGKLYENKVLSVLFSTMICLCPWNVINSRWGLDANLAPGLFFIGTYYLLKFLKGSKKSVIPAFILYGLTLYSYAMTWMMIPFFLIIVAILMRERIKYDKFVVSSIIILMIFALPLILFIVINMEILPEIKTPFFSVPKMAGFRSNEISLSNLGENIKGAIKLLIMQHDLPYISSEAVGGLYRHLTPFYIFGILYFLFGKATRKASSTTKCFDDMSMIFLIWLIVAGIACILKSQSTTTHFNMIFFPLIYFEVYGIYVIGRFIWRMNRRMVPVYAAVLVITQAVSFGIFAKEYVAENGNQDSQFYTADTAEAIEYAKSVCGDGNICICEILTINYSFLLWHDLPDPIDFSENAVYADYGTWNYVAEFGNYRYYPAMSEVIYNSDNVYILPNDNEKILPFEKEGFVVDRINNGYAVAFIP